MFNVPETTIIVSLEKQTRMQCEANQGAAQLFVVDQRPRTRVSGCDWRLDLRVK